MWETWVEVNKSVLSLESILTLDDVATKIRQKEKNCSNTILYLIFLSDILLQKKCNLTIFIMTVIIKLNKYP